MRRVLNITVSKKALLKNGILVGFKICLKDVQATSQLMVNDGGKKEQIKNCMFLQERLQKNLIENPLKRLKFEAMFQLTENAIAKMLKVQQGKNESFIVDVVKLRKKKDNYMSFLISDGKATCKCVVDVSQPKKDIQALMKKNNNQPLRINITSHISVSNKQQAGIEVISFQLKPKIVQTKLQLQFRSKPVLIKRQEVQKRHHSYTQQKFPLLQQKHDQSTSQSSEINIKGYELISDLYENFYGWVLLTRVVDIQYEQFTSRAGNLVKVLVVDLLDRCQNMIIGKFFGDIAVKRQNMIEKGKIYKVSKGKIIVDKYPCKNGSKYSIIFNYDSQFSEINDPLPQFPKVYSNWMRLSQIATLPLETSSNFVGILIELDDQTTIQKEGRRIVFQRFKIGDPISQLVYNCTIWNKTINADELIGKSILIKNIKVSSYKGEITLCTTPRSHISSHPFFAKFNDDTQQFQSRLKETLVSNIQQILVDVPQHSGIVVKTVEAWIAEIGFNTRWFYESCPKCRKACSSNTTCQGCSFAVTDSIKRFKVIIELSDYTGSIRATSFQQSAKILINYVQMSELLTMDEAKLIELGRTLCFQQYRMQISTKKDQNGRVSHSIVGKPTMVSVSRTIARNLQEIRQMSKRIKQSQ